MGYHVPEEETLDPRGLEQLQRRKLAALLEQVLATNTFYRSKFAGLRFDPLHDPLDRLPFTTRAELEHDQRDHPPYGTNLTFPLERYTRLHQTSASGGGAPLRWLDTPESWAWFKRCWRIIYAAADVTAADRIVFPFSFGPFIGFWGAFEAGCDLGALCLSAGGMTTSARLRYLLDHAVTVVCCTPTYALHMAEVAAAEGLDLRGSAVRALIVAGEPGGSIPATRNRIEDAWGARIFDHAGMTEIGAWGFEPVELAPAARGMLVIESEFIAEAIHPQTLAPVRDGQTGELVLTNLGRIGSPLIRYRTGDIVRLTRGRCVAGRWFAFAEGGVLGRSDDMLIVRGNNVFPSAIEDILREIPELAEFRLCITQPAALAELQIEVEPTPGTDGGKLVERVTNAVRDRLNFRPDVAAVPPGSLPRFEHKARRVVRR